ncbi:MAG TPA: deoxyguanosinetriphosphate triphosphohydrolase [Bacillota bacterium]|nr:deoxyguanosinetriphosphate triphosphohydrolase [Bacillota bacterium]
MANLSRQKMEESETLILAPFASKSGQTRGRRFAEDEDNYRTCFQRDRDRIMYTMAFKNLQFKTQVFLVHEGESYRTRLTHTLEVMQHARTFARVLGANEDLVESISLAHDLGHTPFGHAGEEILSLLLKDYGGFDHNLHSLRVVDDLEERYPSFPGLNLTYETREGLARHLTRYDNPNIPPEFQSVLQPSIEAQIVNISDALAFAAHDLDDALKVGLVSWDDVTSLGIPLIKQIESEIISEEKASGSFSAQMRHYRLIRHLIYHFNEDCILSSSQNLDRYHPRSVEDIKGLSEPAISLSPERQRDLEMLNSFLYNQVYKHPMVLMMAEKGKLILEKLYDRFWSNPKLLPSSVWQKAGRISTTALLDENTKAILICDYLAGLTDRQAMDIYEMMFEPYTKVMSFGFGKS